jgi:hypothetical protein
MHFSIVKKIVASPENQNGVTIQDGVENVSIYHPKFSKMIFLSVFLLFFYILGENKIFMEKLFT